MEEVSKKKSKVLSYVFGLIPLTIFFVIIFLMDYFGGREISSSIIGVLSDAFSLAGLLGVLFWLLIFVTNEGAFDIIVYGTKKAFYAIFRKDILTAMPRTLHDYREEKKDKGKNMFFPFLIDSLVFLVVGIIFIVIFYVV